jgi:hypothetical protein
MDPSSPLPFLARSLHIRTARSTRPVHFEGLSSAHESTNYEQFVRLLPTIVDGISANDLKLALDIGIKEPDKVEMVRQLLPFE